MKFTAVFYIVYLLIGQVQPVATNTQFDSLEACYEFALEAQLELWMQRPQLAERVGPFIMTSECNLIGEYLEL